MGGWERVLIGVVLAACNGSVTAEPPEDDPSVGGPYLFVDEVPVDPCLPRAALSVLPDGSVECTMVEVRVVDGGGRCAACDSGAGRGPVSDHVARAVQRKLEVLGRCASDTRKNCSGPSAIAAGHCQCELRQLSGDDGVACRTETAPQVSGWCFVDPARGLGDPALVASCPEGYRKIFRFVGSAMREGDATTFIACPGVY